MSPLIDSSFCFATVTVKKQHQGNLADDVFGNPNEGLAVESFRFLVPGLFYFDYIESEEPIGLDTPGGAIERTSTLNFLNGQLDICFGDFKVDGQSVGVCVGRKK